MYKVISRLAFCFSLLTAVSTVITVQAENPDLLPMQPVVPKKVEPAPMPAPKLLQAPKVVVRSKTPKAARLPPKVSVEGVRPASKAEKAGTLAPRISYSKQVSEARRAYEAGKYAAAAQIYERLPASSMEFMRTREELAWTYLRHEDWSKLRGLLADLNTKLVPLRWRLEGRVLSSMLYLKDCQYEKVRTELEQFQTEMAPLAHTVERRLATSPNSAYWHGLKQEMSEAIFKMKFVRMELRSRLVMLTRSQVIDMPERKAEREPALAGAQTYPVNGDIWADEIFEKRGEGPSACATLHKAKVIQ